MYQICHKFVLRPRTCISIYISPLMEGINYYCFSFSILPSFWAYGKVTLSFSLILNQCHVTRSGHCYFWKKISLSVQFSHSVVSNSLQPHGLQHARLLCPSPTPRACSNSCPSSRWCHPTISSSVFPYSSCLQSFLASGLYPFICLWTFRLLPCLDDGVRVSF